MGLYPRHWDKSCRTYLSQRKVVPWVTKRGSQKSLGNQKKREICALLAMGPEQTKKHSVTQFPHLEDEYKEAHITGWSWVLNSTPSTF